MDKICNNLDRKGAGKAKRDMLTGNITPKQVAKNNDEIYEDEE